MRIVTPDAIENPAWDGYLEPLGETFGETRSLARVTLGEPMWWPAAKALDGDNGQQWKPPVGDRTFALARLTCTLHPPESEHARYTKALLKVYLRPRHGAGAVIAYDMYPQRLTAEVMGKFNFGLGPDLKFASLAEVKLMKIGAEIEYKKLFPVIQAFGESESTPYWQFEHHASHPLLGCQSVYLVIAAPLDADGVRLSVEMVATAQTRLGPVRLGLPETAQASVGCLLTIQA